MGLIRMDKIAYKYVWVGTTVTNSSHDSCLAGNTQIGQ